MSGLDSPQKGSYHQGLSLPDQAGLDGLYEGSCPPGRRLHPLTTGFSAKGFLGMSTFMASAQHAADGVRWHLIDADGRVLGRVATRASRLLQGKHKPTYTPFIDTGDHVIVVNAAKVKLTGRKEDQKIYRQHSGYEGGLREERARIVRAKKPERLVEEAVRGMLPKTKLGEAMYRKLKVYAGPDHPHAAQKPSKLEVA
jgi:large subunit ribosomal protein L13